MNEHLAGDLWIIYAVDMPDAIVSLSKENAQELGLDVSALRSLAIENLRRILPPIEQHGEDPISCLPQVPTTSPV